MGKIRPSLWLWGGLLPACVVALDQWSKAWAIGKFGVPHNICAINPYPNLSIEISPVFDLALVCNQGVSFHMFSGHGEVGRIVLTAFALIMCVVLLVWLNRERSKLMSLSLGLIIGGAIGNAIDRARYGAVTDFLNFSDIHFIWVFNVADSAITTGVAGLLLSMFLQERARKRHSESG
ncbi:MAG TPA: signal peptidase II [Hellea balneolensis]|uniref:Lipoprotein signal peptidase n=1 Tax=Hellea balneolensis TaxID=287478 RepID=A0A7V5U1K5_9PROT|nr:signal peptidase II [Hellea balneolensis]